MNESDHSKDFFPHTSEKSPNDGRSLEAYESMLGFDRKELEGKTVLDLGSGATDYFSNQLKNSGVKARVVSVNPDLSLRDSAASLINWRDNIQYNSNSNNEQYVAAVGQELPFASETFDRILALESVSKYAQEWVLPGATKLWTAEEYRVLKKGGEATFIHSPHYDDRAGYLAECEFQVKLLKEAGFDVTEEGFSHKDLKEPLIRIRARKHN